MKNFDIAPYTHIFFGENQLNNFISAIAKEDFTRVLLVYGKNSIKKTGLYDEVLIALKENKIDHWDLPNVDPNPKLSSVKEGIKLCYENKITMVLALGGGSVIDCSKAIALGIANKEEDIWEIIYNAKPIEQALPVASVLTVAATASEVNATCVITHDEKKIKLGYSACPKLRPRFALLDPRYTFSVSKYQTASGAADILSHVMENYFCMGEATDTTDFILEGIAKSVIRNLPLALNEPNNYNVRANLMWASSMAHNYFCNAGRIFDGAAHHIEHALSAHFNIPHGHGLSIIYPRMLLHVLDENNQDRYIQFFDAIFGLEKIENRRTMAEQGVQKLIDFFELVGCPKRLKDFNIPETDLEKIAQECISIRSEIRPIPDRVGTFRPLSAQDIYEIYKESY